MSYSNDTLKLLSTVLSEIQLYQQNSLSCDIINSSSLLKNFNFIILNSSPPTVTTESIQSDEATNSTDSNGLRNDYDYPGSLIYILFILFWYSLCIIAMIKIQTKKNDLDYFEDSDDSEDNNAHALLKRIRDDKVKKEALEELVKPDFRDKMWDIYLENPNTYKIRKFESKKIQQIDRKLKQYYTQKSGELIRDSQYKTVDFSQLDRGNRAKADSTNLFLLRDVNKFEPSPPANLYHINQSSLTSNNNRSSYPTGPFMSNFNSTQQANLTTAQTANRFKVEKIQEFQAQ